MVTSHLVSPRAPHSIHEPHNRKVSAERYKENVILGSKIINV
jgi:hypothetical protein